MTAPRSRPGQQAHPSDVTGRKREALAKEHAEELARREGEISLMTAEKQRSYDEDIIDPDERVILKPDGSIVKMDNDEEDESPRLLGTGDSTIEELNEVTTNVSTVSGDMNEKVVIRVNSDLEEVTLGYGNVVSFKEGGRYRVPRWVADHLEDKGLVWGRG